MTGPFKLKKNIFNRKRKQREEDALNAAWLKQQQEMQNSLSNIDDAIKNDIQGKLKYVGYKNELDQKRTKHYFDKDITPEIESFEDKYGNDEGYIKINRTSNLDIDDLNNALGEESGYLQQYNLEKGNMSGQTSKQIFIPQVKRRLLKKFINKRNNEEQARVDQLNQQTKEQWAKDNIDWLRREAFNQRRQPLPTNDEELLSNAQDIYDQYIYRTTPYNF